MAVLPGFIGATYALRSLKADCQHALNLIPELIESRAGANQQIGVLLSVPGLLRLVVAGEGPVRGAYTTSTGRLAVAVGNTLYQVSSQWEATAVGILLTNEGPVDMTDNGQVVAVVDGAYGYTVSMLTGEFKRIESEGFSGGDRITFVDGYFIVNNPGTGQFCLSDLYDGSTWDGLMIGTAEGSPDALVAVVANDRQVWALGTQSGEVYWNSGAEFPFSRIDGSFMEVGCAAAQTAQKFGGSIAWLGSNGQVLMANGFNPQRISNHSVELVIRQAGDVSTACAWTYAQDGHTFYCLDLPGASSTWCYDLATGQWHERVEMGAGGMLTRSRVSCHAYAYNTHVVGDRSNGRLYALDMDTYDNDGDVLVRERTSPRFSRENRLETLDRLEIDMQTGVGLDGIGQGTTPQVMLQISRDGGNTWGQEKWQSLGAIGEFGRRVIWRRLGHGRNWVCKVRVTDPVKVVFTGAFVEVS